ncbi:hypothetical protein QQZ08_007542 [Neonectria magnoliae]|uniref:Rhodopsin domain-containing protein n=1 Tax=Neonectria magnoliae TaxID=2732573 RepID=A0ABR1HYU5_9HYPO
MNLTPRDEDGPVHDYVNPYVELNAGLWSLFAGASIFLGLRLYVKVTRRHGLWYDDYILLVSWVILLANNSLIIHEFRTGYVLKDSTQKWDDRMHILINISSCGTLIGQALTKMAFAVTLLRMSNRWQKWILWFCIATMNSYMVVKVLFQWAKVCGKESYQNWYRLDFCIGWEFRDRFKEGGNVYNVIMDFVFASFPWLITRSLEMRRAEKIGLCLTMSLGMIVAIVSAVRIGWKDNGNDRDRYYIWRNGVSQVWYSSEVAGTIMVQCIPILRPILRNIHTSLTSRKLASTVDARSTPWTSKPSGNRASTGLHNNNNDSDDIEAESPARMELRDIPEEAEFESWKRSPQSSTPSEHTPNSYTPKFTTQTLPLDDCTPKVATEASPLDDSWATSRSESRYRSLDVEQDRTSHSSHGFDFDLNGTQGLSAPPRRQRESG